MTTQMKVRRSLRYAPHPIFQISGPMNQGHGVFAGGCANFQPDGSIVTAMHVIQGIDGIIVINGQPVTPTDWDLYRSGDGYIPSLQRDKTFITRDVALFVPKSQKPYVYRFSAEGRLITRYDSFGKPIRQQDFSHNGSVGYSIEPPEHVISGNSGSGVIDNETGFCFAVLVAQFREIQGRGVYAILPGLKFKKDREWSCP